MTIQNYSGKKKHTLKTQYIVNPDGKFYAVSRAYPGKTKTEDVIREAKIFKILSETYRNRHRNHGITTNIIADIVTMKVEKRTVKQAA